MATKNTIDGRLAKFILSEIDDLAAGNQNMLLDLLEKMFGRAQDVEIKLVLRILQNNSVISRIATLMRAGQVQEAENIVMGLTKK